MPDTQPDPRLVELKKAIGEHQQAAADLSNLFEQARAIVNGVTLEKLKAASERSHVAWRAVRAILDAM